MTSRKYSIMMVAGEASGDTHAAKLALALKEKVGDDDLELYGSAGPRMRDAGVVPIVRSDELSIVGLLEIGRALPMFWKTFKKLKAAAIERKPDLVILVDFPDFNLKLAKSLKKRGVKVVYYISPQVWAWRKYRTKALSRDVDLILTILPFEEAWYREQGITHVEYVGNPLARDVIPSQSKEQFCLQHGLDASRPIVALLPGSRHKEIVRILPTLLETGAVMSQRDPLIQFIIPFAREKHRAELEAASFSVPKAWETIKNRTSIVFNETIDALSVADVAAVTSGTATLETGIIGTPMAIVYRSSAINYRLLRPLIDVSHFGLINLIADERVANEYIQDDLNPMTLAAELFRLVKPEVNSEVRDRLKKATDNLGKGGASTRAADAILGLIS
ncbi:lipid-A-disaccharide synthase [soil metagenome]